MTDEALLRTRGLRATRPRLAVLAVLTGHGGSHLDVDEITVLVRQRLRSVSTQAVYDVLNALCRVGLARRVEPAGSPARFETATSDPHPHAVCRDCGTIADLDNPLDLSDPADLPSALAPANYGGFSIDEVEIIFWGLCPDCQKTPGTSESRASTEAHGSLAGASAPAEQILR